MSGPYKNLIEIRKQLKKRIPKFLRVNYARYNKIGDSWRKQRGIHNKIRKSIKGAGAKVSVGYGIPKEMKYIHPSGYKEVLVRNIRDLENIDPKEHAIRLSSTLGLKKRLEILKIAKEKGIYVLNSNVISRVRDKGYSSIKEMLSSIGLRKDVSSSEGKDGINENKNRDKQRVESVEDEDSENNSKNIMDNKDSNEGKKKSQGRKPKNKEKKK